MAIIVGCFVKLYLDVCLSGRNVVEGWFSMSERRTNLQKLLTPPLGKLGPQPAAGMGLRQHQAVVHLGQAILECQL